jgi:hypothetical protein
MPDNILADAHLLTNLGINEEVAVPPAVEKMPHHTKWAVLI